MWCVAVRVRMMCVVRARMRPGPRVGSGSGSEVVPVLQDSQDSRRKGVMCWRWRWSRSSPGCLGVSVWGGAVGPEAGLAAWTPCLGRGSESAAKGRRAVAWAELRLGRGSGNQAGSLGWGWGLRAGGWAR